jgi:tetratricopeptide (TPR) repeat protein
MDVFERLATRNPKKYQGKIAMCLNNLALIYSETGQIEEVLAAVEQAIRICKELASAHPDQYEG